MMQNWFATFALLSWPLFAVILYFVLPLNRATIWTILAAQLFLPVGAFLKYEMVPQFDKKTIPNLCILAGCLIVQRFTKAVPLHLVAKFLLFVFLLGPIATSLLNGDPLFYGTRAVAGVGLYDAISTLESLCIDLIPFFIARRFLAQSDDTKEILRALVLAMLFYSVLLFFEMRFSPQLHNWVYGYNLAEFLQSVREEGYRPMAFMGHGLLAAFFVATSLMASVAFWRARTPLINLPLSGPSLYLATLLIMCKSFGATLYATAVAPLIGLASPRSQMRIAVLLVSVCLLYPTLRSMDLFPTALTVDAANLVSTERADSLQFRFEHEDQLLTHAFRRPVLGWGRFGRSRVYDPQTGEDLSVTDGDWVITIGQFGFVGFFAKFGLFAFVVFRAASALKFLKSNQDRIFLCALTLILSINIVDLLPNAGLVPWTWLLVGALLGRADRILASATSDRIPVSLKSNLVGKSQAIMHRNDGFTIRGAERPPSHGA